MSDWSERLNQVLAERRLSQKEGAELAGVKSSTFHKWTVGAVPRKLEGVRRLCNELDISFDWLLTGSTLEKRLSATISARPDHQNFVLPTPLERASLAALPSTFLPTSEEESSGEEIWEVKGTIHFKRCRATMVNE